MPPKSKKQQLYERRALAARLRKTLAKNQDSSPAVVDSTVTVDQDPSNGRPAKVQGPSVSVPSPDLDEARASVDSHSSYDPEETDDPIEMFVTDWSRSLSREDTIALGLFLSFHLVKMFNFTKTKAAENAGVMMGKSDRAIRQWRIEFLKENCIPDNLQGKYQRSGVLWASEELNLKATKFVRENANVKGRPNMTALSFCQWVNENLLPNIALEPGYPRRISVQTARKWLHHLGFMVISGKKGSFFNGHERDDVVAERKSFLTKMAEIGFVHPGNAPTPEAARAFPTSVPLPSAEQRKKTVVLFHDESTFQANDDQVMWGKKGENMLRPKSKGSGIMVSDFVDEHNGYFILTEAEHKQACRTNPDLKRCARQYLEYGESREGYWTSEKFMAQMKIAVDIAEAKYPRESGWKLVWVFDQSSCHKAMSDDALDASAMNVKPGGKQPIMRDTVWAGATQRMVFTNGVAKGLKAVLEERGICTDTLVADQMRTILSNHEDFKSEQPKLIHYLSDRGHTALFLPKFHPELNPIERVWAMSKQYTKAYCKYTLPSLRSSMPAGLDSVGVENIRNFHQKCRNYMFAYFEGHVAGQKIEEQVKKYKKAIKSHRRISIHE